jgi:ubiquinone/menaquinone biosynthesis C-methylase UbiE
MASQYKSMSMDRWTSGAHYDRWMGRWSRLLAREFVSWLAAPAGLRWIDVCCGSGVVTETIVERAAPHSVMGVDASAQQIEFAREHRAHPSVSFETGDAMTLRFPDATFDVAVCGLGLNFIPSPARALEEFRRVVSPGGTIAVYVWDYVSGAMFVRHFWDAAIAVDTESAGKFVRACAGSSYAFRQLRRLLGAAADRPRLRASLSGHARSADSIRHPRSIARNASGKSARRNRNAGKSLGHPRAEK